jgi:hypothetical protein
MQLACSQGNLPVVLTLWGLALPRHINMMSPDVEGNTPVHYSALADNAEVYNTLILNILLGYIYNHYLMFLFMHSHYHFFLMKYIKLLL